MAPISYNLSGRSSDPLDHLVSNPGKSAMAIITGVEGPSYRPVGAIMALGPEGQRVGSLSSGCIEGDLLVHAEAAAKSGSTISVRYGEGSPFRDIALPCGGGLDILIIPNPDSSVLAEVAARRDRREACTLRIDPKTGDLSLDGNSDRFSFEVNFVPEIRFLIFGKGPEASTFAALTSSAGYPSMLLSPDEETRVDAEAAGSVSRYIAKPGFPEDLAVDRWTAILTFFHDHEWEPEILAPALKSQAFYVGAQGSQRAAAQRRHLIRLEGVDQAQIDRLKGPIGLVPSARDARTLAVSVLAEVLETSRRMRLGGDVA